MVARYGFDPGRDGFGFRNPARTVPEGAGGGKLLRRLDGFLYGRGLCFGMAVASLRYFVERGADPGHQPLAELPPAPGLLGDLRGLHARQYGPRVVAAVARDWVASNGGRAETLLGRLRLVGESPDPHVLCLGPGLCAKGFFSRLSRAHAVVPYRVEEGRVYVYDPNYPGDRERFLELRRDRGFVYDGFRSREGWGVTLVPLSVVRVGRGIRAISEIKNTVGFRGVR